MKIKRITVGFEKKVLPIQYNSEKYSLIVDVECDLTLEDLDSVYDEVFNKVHENVLRKIKECKKNMVEKEEKK